VLIWTKSAKLLYVNGESLQNDSELSPMRAGIHRSPMLDSHETLERPSDTVVLDPSVERCQTARKLA